VTDISAATRQSIERAAQAADLAILGIHWILVGPEGLHLTSPDAATRDRTAQYLIDLAHFCGDVGGKVMIFGSPKQRDLLDGVTFDKAMDYAAGVFERALPTCEERGVTICMEPLSPKETSFLQTAAETVALVERIGHPNFRLLLDTKAMTDDTDSRPNLIRKFSKHLAHYHANDANLEGPGFGNVDFGPIFDALREVNYTDYVSVEVFVFDPGPESIATKSLRYMRKFV